MKIGIYNPYLHSLSGGERYTTVLAWHWSKNHNVDLFWDKQNILSTLEERFNLDLKKVNIVQNIFSKSSLLRRLYILKKYDLLFILSDGSIPTTLCKRNILHFQIPFQKVAYSGIKLSRYQKIICNSMFTKNNIDICVRDKCQVIYPPIDVDKFQPNIKRSKIILSVGRFSNYHGSKKQEILINAFIEGYKSHLFSDYHLYFVGGLLETDHEYFKSLQKLVTGYPIKFFSNCKYHDLQKMYESSEIYWHAAGYNEQNPELMEHFGISTVEALAGGCIPVVFNGGGQTEIISEGKNGFLWSTVPELINKTKLVIRNSQSKKNFEQAIAKSKNYSTVRFCESYDKLLNEIM